MALVLKDRVQETTTTIGTGTIALGGAVSGFQSFSVIGNANSTYYVIFGGTEWEIGIGSYTASSNTLSRDTVLESSNNDNLVNFSAGTKSVFVTYPADKSIYKTASGVANLTSTDITTALGFTPSPATSGTSILYGNGFGGFNNVTVGSGLSFSSGTLSASGGGGMTYPGAGIALSTGTSWDTSITNNSSNWNDAYTDRFKWDGGSTGLTASTGRTSLGVTATGADTTYAYRANNLSDLTNATTARTNLGLGSIATQAANNVTISGGSITGITDLAVADGGTGSSTLSTNAVLLGNGTSALQTVAPGTSGNVLTSNGTTWQSTAPTTSSITLLGTITPTAVNSISLGSLTLTSYKALYIVFNGVNQGATTDTNFVSSNNQQTGGGIIVGSSGANSGGMWLDLATGALGGAVSSNTVSSNSSSVGGLTNVTTSSTIIYFRLSGTKTFTAVGSIRIYGVS